MVEIRAYLSALFTFKIDSSEQGKALAIKGFPCYQKVSSPILYELI